MFSRKRSALAVLLAVMLIFCFGCDYLEKRNVRELLDKKAKALTERRTGAYLSYFSTGYRDDWLSFGEAVKKAMDRMEKTPQPVISFGKAEIFIEGEKAVVSESFTMEDASTGRPRVYNEVQHLRLKKIDGEWKITSGSEVLRLLGGRVEEESKIENLLLRREAALVRRDIDVYMDLVSDNYSHKGNARADIEERVRRIFQVYDDISIRSFDRKIWFFGDTAVVEQSFTMTATALGEPKTITDKERFELEKTEEGWKFSKGL